ncbi:glutathione S-transferase family protein [Hyphomicrobium sp.]|uniref:glutathione S-transferase family protein n=1 Tax=Hyphomicrobium sp. TaxID=82 RepID=UPI002D7946E4|nr:glutathione S-transferase family protein [Hyphomicrobium sp.]HET6388509.1 glutathione S-transferase family protein [Hyphomicrobium sp.]
MPPRLTQYRLCPRSRSIRLALAEYGVEVQLVDENPWEWRQSFLAKNPAGEMPVLEFDNGLILCGAYSISEFIAEEVLPVATMVAPGPPPLIPGNREDRAEIRRLIDWYHGKFDREVTRELLVEKVYSSMLPTGPVAPDPGILRAVRANLKYHLSYTGYLADSRRWLAGDELSFADIAAAAQISTADYLGEIPWNDYPTVKVWYQRMKSRPSFRPLLSDRVPGTAPPLAYSDLDF